jgi:membrane protein required for colicin V production
MADLDWIFGAVMVASTLLGMVRGLVKEVLSWLSWVAAFLLAQRLAPDVAQWMPLAGASETLRFAAGFVLSFIATLLAAGLVTMAIKRLLSIAGLSPMDRLLGGAFGAARGVVLLLAATVVVDMTPLHVHPAWIEARGPQISQWALNGLKPQLPPEFAKFLP